MRKHLPKWMKYGLGNDVLEMVSAVALGYSIVWWWIS